MKKTLILYLFFSVNIVLAQQTYVPDDNFEQALIDLGYDDVLDDYVLTANIEGVTSLHIVDKYIFDLTGIEGFTSLIELDCSQNGFPFLDMSQSIDLTKLNCSMGLLNSLDVSQNLAIDYLDSSGNPLSVLDVSHNLSLEYLACFGNNLTTLDVTQNLALNYLNCRTNQLSVLDVSHNTALSSLNCEENPLTTIDISQNAALTYLRCGHNLTSLDVSHNIALENLDCRSNQLTQLDVSQNTALDRLWCAHNQLSTLDVRNGNNSNISDNDFWAQDNPNLTCIFVDDATYSTNNWTTRVDPASTFVETQAECDALAIDEIEFNELTEVFPNPTNDLLNIRLLNEIEMNDAVLYNYLGDIIIKTSKNFMDVSNLKTGIYILRIITKDDRILSKRIIIRDE